MELSIPQLCLSAVLSFSLFSIRRKFGEHTSKHVFGRSAFLTFRLFRLSAFPPRLLSCRTRDERLQVEAFCRSAFFSLYLIIIKPFKFLDRLGLTRPEKKILLAVFSILTAMCTLAYVAHWKSQELIRTAEAIEYSEEIKYHIQGILSSTVDMEAGIRGYVMIGEEAYLTPAKEAISGMFVHLHELSSLPGLSEKRKDQITQLRKLVDEKSTYTTRIAEIRRLKGMDEAVAFITGSSEKNLMDQIRDITAGMLGEEEGQLAELKKKNRSAILHFAVTFYLLLLKISVTVITVIFLFVFYLRNRNKAEIALKESQTLFQNVLDHTSSVITIKDLSGRYILINQAYANMLNIPKDSAVGKTVDDLYEKNVAEKIRHSDFEVIKLQQQVKTEETIPGDNGMIHFVSLKFPLFDANHIPYAICSISSDETDKLLSEIQHREEVSRIMDLFNNAPCGYQATNADGIVVEINETLLKWLGYTRQEIVGKMPVKNLISPDSLHEYAYYFPRIRNGEIKSIFDVHVNYLRKDGSRLAIVANSLAHYDDDGQFMYTRTSIFDVSYRTRSEEISVRN